MKEVTPGVFWPRCVVLVAWGKRKQYSGKPVVVNNVKYASVIDLLIEGPPVPCSMVSWNLMQHVKRDPNHESNFFRRMSGLTPQMQKQVRECCVS